jgi:hypothetical protein
MGSALVTLPDGRRAKVSYETQDQLDEAVAELERPVSVGIGENLRAIPRQVGLAARYGIEGLGDVAGIVVNPVAAFGNEATEAMGMGRPFPITGTGGLATQAADAIGLPSPEGADERVVGDVSRLMVGAGAMAGGANTLAQGATGAGKAALTQLAANPGSQIASAAGAGAAGGSVREAGGGPWEQFAASLLGGIAAPVALSAAQSGGRQLANTVRAALKPNEIDGQVQVVFERAGVDWGKLSAGARQQLVEDAKAAVYSGQNLDDMALRRLADYRSTGATPLTGDITQDPGLLTKQRNLAKTQANMSATGPLDLSRVQNQNAKAVLGVLDDSASSSKDAYATGQSVIERVKSADDALTVEKNAAYNAARDATGQDIPLTPATFINKAREELDRQLKGKHLPAEISNTLDDIASGKAPFDVRIIDILKTDLATASRGSKDGNVRAAIKIVRDALESTEPKLGQFGGSQVVTKQAGDAIAAASKLPKEALTLLDKARKLSASQFKWRESAPFIEDALGGAEPDRFVQKHVINGSVSSLAKLRKLAGGDPILRDAVRTQLVGYIKARGGADTDATKFSSAGLEKGLEQIGDRKLSMWFTPQEINKLKSAVRVAKYMQSQPIGSAVNNSNSGAMIVGKVLDFIQSKSKLVPLGEAMIAGPITNIRAGAQARQLQNISGALVVPTPRQPLPAGALALGAAVPPRDKDSRN